MSHPTKVHEHREIYRGRIFSLAVDRVTLPSGHTVSMEVVRHPGSVVLLPMPAPDRLILIRQYRYVIDRFIWELPAGSLKPGEDPRLGAARECEEEVGLVPGTLEQLGEFFPTPGFCDERMTFFRCTALTPPLPDSTARQDEDEVIEPAEFDVAEVRRMIGAGEIVDMKTVTGLAMLG
ncbi:MAG: NUDIX hydrolase [Acidobacteria bacterium]|nr:NUDIX hydrolase [Acidobacteriota bacterium]